MKKITLLALALATLAQSAFAGEKEGIEALYHDAKPLVMVGPFVDSKGCLWGVDEDHGVVRLIQIVAGGKQVCRKPQK